MTDIKKYKSKNPIIQKCLDILDNPDIQIKEIGPNHYSIYLKKEKIFSITNSSLFLPHDIDFYSDRKENGMCFSDIILIFKKTQQIVQSHEAEKVQNALNQLYSEPKAEQGKKKKNQVIANQTAEEKHIGLVQHTMRRMKQAMQQMLDSYEEPTKQIETNKVSKNKKTQYAVPYEVSEAQEYFNAEKGLVGYNIGVRFKGLSNFPTPHFFDCENMHMYQDVNAGTIRVVYHFPFVGYGIINYGKLAAKHWYKKMKKQADTYNMQQKTK